jgi:hypothetical protein
MHLRRLLAAGLIAGAAAVAATALGATGLHRAKAADLKPLDDVNFITLCRFSHRASDDPIVFPRRPEMSHDHTFVGNVSTDAFSTLRSLRAAGTSCQRSDDTAAYWAPTLLVKNEPVAPLEARIYYRRATLVRVRAFPPGLKMIAGDSHAMKPQSRSITFWDCGDRSGVAASSAVPTCPAGTSTSLRLHVHFPDCWDGKRLDSADHKSHMAYSSAGRCPATHPVAVPALALVLQYPVSGGRGVELASMGQFSGHADFMNAWEQPALERLVDSCLNALRLCGAGF